MLNFWLSKTNALKWTWILLLLVAAIRSASFCRWIRSALLSENWKSLMKSSRSEHAQFQDFKNWYFPHKHCLGTLMVEVRSHFNEEHMLCICIWHYFPHGSPALFDSILLYLTLFIGYTSLRHAVQANEMCQTNAPGHLQIQDLPTTPLQIKSLNILEQPTRH